MLGSQTLAHSAPPSRPPTDDFSSVALEMARSLEEGVSGSFVSERKCTKGIAPFCAVLEERPTCCWRACRGSGHHTSR